MPCPYCKKPTPKEDLDRGIDHKTMFNSAQSNCTGWFCPEYSNNKNHLKKNRSRNKQNK